LAAAPVMLAAFHRSVQPPQNVRGDRSRRTFRRTL
jgi:hypothetical protein